MGNSNQSQLPEGKYNKWCERHPIINTNVEQWHKIDSYYKRDDLTPYEKSVFYFHKHTNCRGIEFVAFANIRLKQMSILANNVTLVPCFLHNYRNVQRDDPILQATFKMMSNGRFIYDGWVPLKEWTEQSVRNTIRHIDEALSIFCLRGRSYITWEPKYTENFSTFNLYHDFHLDEIEQIMMKIESLPIKDRTAIYRSLGWLSKGIHLNDSIVRFFFSILAIESLAIYIENTAPDESPFATLRPVKLTKAERKSERENCIEKIIITLYNENKTRAITNAYFDCVVGLTRILKNHISHLFEQNSEPYKLLFEEKIDGKSLYDLRHEIAHGSADVLSEVQREQIRKRVSRAESLAREYIITVLEKALRIKFAISKGMFESAFTLLDLVGNNASMYSGPTHMALLYS